MAFHILHHHQVIFCTACVFNGNHNPIHLFAKKHHWKLKISDQLEHPHCPAHFHHNESGEHLTKMRLIIGAISVNWLQSHKTNPVHFNLHRFKTRPQQFALSMMWQPHLLCLFVNDCLIWPTAIAQIGHNCFHKIDCCSGECLELLLNCCCWRLPLIKKNWKMFLFLVDCDTTLAVFLSHCWKAADVPASMMAAMCSSLFSIDPSVVLHNNENSPAPARCWHVWDHKFKNTLMWCFFRCNLTMHHNTFCGCSRSESDSGASHVNLRWARISHASTAAPHFV